MSFNEEAVTLNTTTENKDVSTSNNTDLNSEEKYQIKGDELPRKLQNVQEIVLKINNGEKSNKIRKKNFLLYGNHIENLHPKYLGKSRAFLYINNYPLIIIGPDCKFYFYFLKINNIKKIAIVFVFYRQL